jgi:tRNA(adenine34) deaminase
MAKKRSTRRWVKTVKTDSTHPPPRTFTGSAAKIARTLARRDVSPKGVGSGIRMIQYFINRGGKGLSATRRRELERAKRLLQQRAAAQKPRRARSKRRKRRSKRRKAVSEETEEGGGNGITQRNGEAETNGDEIMGARGDSRERHDCRARSGSQETPVARVSIGGASRLHRVGR